MPPRTFGIASSFRGSVIRRWEKKGRPEWDYEATRKACLRINRWMADRGLNPAPKFRKNIDRGDDRYIRTWIVGCHFEWLNPRGRIGKNA